MHTWSSADPNVCGATPMTCPLRDGTTKTMGAADCVHEPLRAAIAAQGAGSTLAQPARLRQPGRQPGSCATHVVTNKDAHEHRPGRRPPTTTARSWTGCTPASATPSPGEAAARIARAFERDRRRDQRARRAGWELLRFTSLQLLREPGWVTASTARVLAR